MKDILLIAFGALFGASLAYVFDLIKRYSDKRSKRKDELFECRNDLLLICSKLNYFTEIWFLKFVRYHYYQALHYRTNEPEMTSLMFMNNRDADETQEKIAELIFKADNCFDKIHRLVKIDFGDDELFIKEYKMQQDNEIFNDIPNTELKQKLDMEIKNIEIKMNEKYKSVFSRIENKLKSIK